MKKVLHLVTKSSFGGAQKYVLDLAESLQDEYEQLVVYGANSFGGPETFKEQLQKLDVMPVFIPSMDRDVSVGKELTSFRTLYGLLKRERPNVLHVNSAKAAGLGALAGRMVGTKKIIYTVHGLALSEDRPLVQKAFIAMFSWITFMLSHRIIFVSHKEFSHVQSWPRVSKKSVVIHNGIQNIEFIKREESRRLLEKKINQSCAGKFLIGGIGELNTNKGMTYLLQALEQGNLKNTIYVHWGTGELEEGLKEEIQKRGLKDQIFLLGFDVGAKKYLRGLDLFVLPSIKEGLGYVLLEAGQANLPVIASNTGGIPEIIKHQSTGLLVTPKDISGWTQAICDIRSHPEISKELASNLYTHVHENFSLESMVSKTKKVYES